MLSESINRKSLPLRKLDRFCGVTVTASISRRSSHSTPKSKLPANVACHARRLAFRLRNMMGLRSLRRFAANWIHSPTRAVVDKQIIRTAFVNGQKIARYIPPPQFTWSPFYLLVECQSHCSSQRVMLSNPKSLDRALSSYLPEPLKIFRGHSKLPYRFELHKSVLAKLCQNKPSTLELTTTLIVRSRA